MKNWFEQVLEEIGDSYPIYLTFMGWEDGDYFLEICRESSGVDNKNLAMYKTLNKPLKVESLEKLKYWLTKYRETPRIACKENEHFLNYDLHVWAGRTNIVANAYLNMMQHRKMNLYQRFIKPAIIPQWLK